MDAEFRGGRKPVEVVSFQDVLYYAGLDGPDGFFHIFAAFKGGSMDAHVLREVLRF